MTRFNDTMEFPIDEVVIEEGDKDDQAMTVFSSSSVFAVQSIQSKNQELDESSSYLCDDFHRFSFEDEDIEEDDDDEDIDEDNNANKGTSFASVTSSVIYHDAERLQQQLPAESTTSSLNDKVKMCHDKLQNLDKCCSVRRNTSDFDTQGTTPTAMTKTVSLNSLDNRTRVHFPPEGCEVSHVFECPWFITNEDWNVLYYTGHELQK